MFLIKLLLLPIRGLLLIVFGAILASPIIFVAGLAWPDLWIPGLFESLILKKTGATCTVVESDISPLHGEYSFKNVIIGNSSEFMSSDFLKINEFSAVMPITHFAKSIKELSSVTVDIGYVGFIIGKDGKSNVSKFFEKVLTNVFNDDKTFVKRNFVIGELTFKFKGIVAVRDYSAIVPKTREFSVSMERKYSNVIHNAESVKLMLGTSQYVDYLKVVGDIEREFGSYGVGVVAQTFVESVKKVPAISGFVE